MTFPRWFFYVAGAVLVLSGVVRLLIAWPRKPLAPKASEPEAPLSKYPRQIGMMWSAVYVAVGVLVILYAAGAIPGPGGR